MTPRRKQSPQTLKTHAPVERCYQCDLDIPHVCYADMPDARWGLGDEALAALEGARRHGFMLASSPSTRKRGPR